MDGKTSPCLAPDPIVALKEELRRATGWEPTLSSPPPTTSVTGDSKPPHSLPSSTGSERTAVTGDSARLSVPAGRSEGCRFDPTVSKRREVIQLVAAEGHEGEAYCRKLHELGLKTPDGWWRREGCPPDYLDAPNHPDPARRKKFRALISREKSRYAPQRTRASATLTPTHTFRGVRHARLL